MSASFYKICNIQINTRPMDGETVVGKVVLVELTEHCCSETVGDVEVAAVYYQVIIDAEVVFDVPNSLPWLFQGGLLIWEAA